MTLWVIPLTLPKLRFVHCKAGEGRTGIIDNSCSLNLSSLTTHFLSLNVSPNFNAIFYELLEGIKVNVGGESPKDHQIVSVALKMELDLRFYINNLKYPDIHVHVAYNSYLTLWPPRPG